MQGTILLVEVLLLFEVVRLAFYVELTSDLVASFTDSALWEVVVRALAARPALVWELEAPSVSHALLHVVLDTVLGHSTILPESLGLLSLISLLDLRSKRGGEGF